MSVQEIQMDKASPRHEAAADSKVCTPRSADLCGSTTSGEPPQADVSPKTENGQKKYDGLAEHECTTLMVRNIPNKYSQRMVLGVIEKHGFKGTFDFLYVPSDFSTRVNVGYCFVNFTQATYAQEFARVFHRMHLSGFKSKKLVQISLGTTQGFMPNIKKFEDSTLCSEFVAPEFHPLIFNTKTGDEITFRSLMPGYEPLPPSRIDNAEYWNDKDEEKKWDGDSLYPTVCDDRPKTTSVSRQNSTLERQTSGLPQRQTSAGKKHANGNKKHLRENKYNSPGSTPKNHGKGGKSHGKGGSRHSHNKPAKGEGKGAAANAGDHHHIGFELSPRARALHNQRYSARAASESAPSSFFGAPPGYGQPRYSRQHGYEGYPLPTAELFDMYTDMGPAYRLPQGGRRASIGAPPGLSRGGSTLTPDFTEFVTRLERDIEYDYAMAAITARREVEAQAARSPASWRR